jgi:RnfABCDGE-type electron transport complex G subunit
MNSRPWMIGLLIIMAVICSSSLALVNIITGPRIEQNEMISAMGTVLDVFGIPFDSDAPQEIIDTYTARIEEVEQGTLTLFRDTDTGGTALLLEGGGFQGQLSMVIALDGDTVTGFRIVRQDETPGLGARITEKEFQESFTGKKVSDGIRMSRSGTAGPSEFDAITGATETSKALEKILNNGFKNYYSLGSE